MINIGLDLRINTDLKFEYGNDTFGPSPELRHLNDIRKSLLDQSASGPDTVYSIAMDVGRNKDLVDLKNRMLLFGAVVYNKGQIGREPVRSQGHIHAISSSCGSSTPEVYEIWSGEAVVMIQPNASNNPKECFAVHAQPGDVVIVPPSWAHCTINSRPETELAFGAWCIRDFGFEYKDIRKHHGLAFYPIVAKNQLGWLPNLTYRDTYLIEKSTKI